MKSSTQRSGRRRVQAVELSVPCSGIAAASSLPVNRELTERMEQEIHTSIGRVGGKGEAETTREQST